MENRIFGLSMCFWFKRPLKCGILALFRTVKSAIRLLFLHPLSFHAVKLFKLSPINLPDFLRDELFDVVPICLDKHGRAFLVFRIFKIGQGHPCPEHGIVGVLYARIAKPMLCHPPSGNRSNMALPSNISGVPKCGARLCDTIASEILLLNT